MKCLLLVLLGLFLKTISFGQVTITQPSLSINSCVTPTNYFLLGNITITETLDSDFSSTSNSTIVINAPTNLEFEPNIGSVSHSPGKNISKVLIYHKTSAQLLALDARLIQDIETIRAICQNCILDIQIVLSDTINMNKWMQTARLMPH